MGISFASTIRPNQYNHIRDFHKRLILDMVRFTPGKISRAELARQMELSRAAISVIVDELLNADMVHEVEYGIAPRGRRPILLEMNPEYGTIVGIDIGVTHIAMVLTDFCARIKQEIERPFDIQNGPEDCLIQVDSVLQELLSQANYSLNDISAIGIGLPGPVMKATGQLAVTPELQKWENYPVLTNLQKQWKRPISLHKDAELSALGEWAYGAGSGYKNLAYIKVGYRITSGLIFNGDIYSGTAGFAGEIGHFPISTNGVLCTCGSYGCLEVQSSGSAIARKAQEAIRSGQQTAMSQVQPVETITARHVAEAANAGDGIANQIITEASQSLSVAIAHVVNLLNPGLVIIGGGVAQLGEVLLDPIRKYLETRNFKESQAVKISTPVLGRNSACLGAVVQATNTVLYH